MTREELIELVERASAGEGTETHHGHLTDVLEENVPHRRVSDLICHHDPERPAAEVVDINLSYRPFVL